MPTHAHTRDVPHSAAELFDLVADIERYPEFLPWCGAARITKRERAADGVTLIVTADLVIAYKLFRERFTSHVTLNREKLRIDVAYLKGPFRHLVNHWRFEPRGEGHATIDFYIDFEFKSRILQKLMEGVFDKAVNKFIAAFIARADGIYGADPPPAEL